MQTYMTLRQNDKRCVRLYLFDRDKSSFQCDAAYASVLKSDGSTIVRNERGCLTDSESIWDLIETDVTNTVGVYYIKWRILKDDEVFYHLTKIEVI